MCALQGNIPAVFCSWFAAVYAKKANLDVLYVVNGKHIRLVIFPAGHRIHCSVLVLLEYVLFVTAVAVIVLINFQLIIGRMLCIS